MLTRPAATSLMPIWAPPWAMRNFTLPGWSFVYLAASSDTSGYEAVAPLMVIVVAAEAAAGAAAPSTPATVRAAEIRRMRVIEYSSVSWIVDDWLTNCEWRIYHNPDRFDPVRVFSGETRRRPIGAVEPRTENHDQHSSQHHALKRSACAERPAFGTGAPAAPALAAGQRGSRGCDARPRSRRGSGDRPRARELLRGRCRL